MKNKISDTVTALEFMTGLFELDRCIINKDGQVLNINYTFCFLNEAKLQTGPFFMKANNI